MSPKLRQSTHWNGTHRSVFFTVKHTEVARLGSLWTYYVFLPEYKLGSETFEPLWLKPEESYNFPSFEFYAYESLPPAQVDWHGGVTFYRKHGETVGCRSIELGCDYAHCFDQGKTYALEDVLADVKHTINQLITLYPQLSE